MNNSSTMACCVIIPTYNSERFIGETLESVFTQKLPPAEVILVDDKSTDNTLNIISQFKRIKLYQNRENSGPNFSRNFALGQTRSPLVAFLDHDDIWHPLHIKLLHDAIISYPQAPAVVGKQTNFQDGDKPIFDVKSQGSQWFDTWDAFPLFNRISTPSAVLVNRDALNRAGNWAPQFTGAADYHLWLRLCAHHPLRLLNAVTIGRRAYMYSFLNNLVNKVALRHMKLRYDACKNALEYLISNYSGNNNNKIEIATKRLQYYQDIFMFVESIIDNNHAEVPGLVEQIANYIESNPDKKSINIFLYLYNNFPQNRNELLSSLYTYWPKRFTRTRDELHMEMPLVVIKT